jgi:hypothetical protein
LSKKKKKGFQIENIVGTTDAETMDTTLKVGGLPIRQANAKLVHFLLVPMKKLFIEFCEDFDMHQFFSGIPYR